MGERRIEDQRSSAGVLVIPSYQIARRLREKEAKAKGKPPARVPVQVGGSVVMLPSAEEVVERVKQMEQKAAHTKPGA